MKTGLELVQDIDHDSSGSWVEDRFAYMADGFSDRFGGAVGSVMGRRVA